MPKPKFPTVDELTTGTPNEPAVTDDGPAITMTDEVPVIVEEQTAIEETEVAPEHPRVLSPMEREALACDFFLSQLSSDDQKCLALFCDEQRMSIPAGIVSILTYVTHQKGILDAARTAPFVKRTLETTTLTPRPQPVTGGCPVCHGPLPSGQVYCSNLCGKEAMAH